jgi:hypothetical protein
MALHSVARWQCIARAADLLEQARVHAEVVGKLRRDARCYEANAERLRRQRRAA